MKIGVKVRMAISAFFYGNEHYNNIDQVTIFMVGFVNTRV